MEILIIKKNKTVLNFDSKSIFTKHYDTEDYITKIMSSKKMEKATIVFLAAILEAQKVYALSDGKGIDHLGYVLINMIRQYAYYILIIMCILEVIRAVASGDSKKILSIIMKYLLVFIAMYLIPGLFDTIRATKF